MSQEKIEAKSFGKNMADSLFKHFEQLDINADKQTNKNTNSENNMNIEQEKKFEDKSLQMINENTLLKKLEELNIEEVSDDQSLYSELSERETQCSCANSADAVRKRGPDRLTTNNARVNPCYPYARHNTHADDTEAHPVSCNHSFTGSYSSEEEKIANIKEFLKSGGNNVIPAITQVVNKNLNVVCSREQLLNDLASMPEQSTQPIPVPHYNTYVEENFSPQSQSSVESGYTSDNHENSCSSSSLETQVMSQNANPSAFVSEFTHQTTVSFDILPVVNYTLQNPVFEEEKPAVCVAPLKKPEVPKKKRNKFFIGICEKEVDKCRRDILRKERKEGGLDMKDICGRTLLHVVIESKQEIYALVLISMVEKSFQTKSLRQGLECFKDLQGYLDQPDKKGRTPLLLACSSNLSKVVDYLLKCGASMSLPCGANFGTVLHYVCERGSRFKDVANILCSNPGIKGYINMKNAKHETPLHLAVSKHGLTHRDDSLDRKETINNMPIIELLMQSGADLSMQDEMGQTALQRAVINQNLQLLKCLQTYTITTNWRRAINAQDLLGMTVLHWAIRSENGDENSRRDLVHYLIAMNAHPGIQDKWGKLPKDYVPAGREDLLKTLDFGYYKLT